MTGRGSEDVEMPSAAAAPLDDDNLLSEILVRLPPQPSSLPRASAVCKRWLLLVSDPGFVRRFRRRHGRSPPLIGCFHKARYQELCFEPTLEAPNRVPPGRFSSPSDRSDDHFRPIGCRHGFLLIFDETTLQFLVWDPVTGHQHRVAIPPEFNRHRNMINGAVLRPAAGDVHFQVIVVSADYDGEMQDQRVLARVYSSETGAWGKLISTPTTSAGLVVVGVSTKPAVLVGHSLYWILYCTFSFNIIKFDLERESLAVIPTPMDIFHVTDCTLMRAEDGGLGLFSVSRFTAELWKSDTDCDGVVSWRMGRTFELYKLRPSLNSDDDVMIQGFVDDVMIQGLAEENKLVLLWTGISLFAVQLESLQFNKLFDTNIWRPYYPFESVYAAGT